ncbi:MAG TPA: hypothetical protein VGK12_03540 [Actinomycetota bacterium]
MTSDRFPTFRRASRPIAAALDPVGVLFAPALWLTIGLLYDAAGDTLSFFGEPGDPTAGRRAVLAGAVLVGCAAVYARRGRPVLAAVLALAGAVPGPLILAFSDTGYGLVAIWTLGPFALVAALVGVLRSPGARPALRRGSATMRSPVREP